MMRPPPLLLIALAGCLLLPASVVSQAQAPAAPGRDTGVADADLARAYGHLAAGRAREAEVGFLALAADAAADEAGPLLGAGLASAVAGEAERAVQRIRAALLRGPAAFVELPGGGEALAGRLREARSVLEAGLLESDDPTGLLLASAAVDYLLGELATAKLSLATAVRRDGLQPPMRALDRLIQQARFAETDGGFTAPVLAGAPSDSATPEPAAPAAPAAPVAPAAPAAEPPAEAAPQTPPRLLRPVDPASEAQRPRVFVDYEKLNLRVSQMAHSLDSFEQKLLRSLMTRPVAPPGAARENPPPAAAE